jgi:hypothetical protein
MKFDAWWDGDGIQLLRTRVVLFLPPCRRHSSRVPRYDLHETKCPPPPSKRPRQYQSEILLQSHLLISYPEKSQRLPSLWWSKSLSLVNRSVLSQSNSFCRKNSPVSRHIRIRIVWHILPGVKVFALKSTAQQLRGLGRIWLSSMLLFKQM